MKHISVVTVAVLLAALPACVQAGSGGNCLIMDQRPDYLYYGGMTVIPVTPVEGGDSTTIAEIEGWWAFAYFKDIFKGDIDINMDIKDTVFFDDANIDLPNQVLKLGIDSGFTWREQGGNSLQFRLKPGYYGDLEEFSGEPFFMPVSVAVIHSFDPALSAMAGVEVRAGFAREVIPLIGLVWDISDVVTLDLRIPKSQLICRMTDQLRTYAGFEWQNCSYDLSDDRGQLTLDDFRLCWGMAGTVTDQLRITGELGYEFSRSVEIGGDTGSRTFDMGDKPYVRLLLGAPF